MASSTTDFIKNLQKGDFKSIKPAPDVDEIKQSNAEKSISENSNNVELENRAKTSFSTQTDDRQKYYSSDRHRHREQRRDRETSSGHNRFSYERHRPSSSSDSTRNSYESNRPSPSLKNNVVIPNAFANDGSFLEMFKKQKNSESTSSSSENTATTTGVKRKGVDNVSAVSNEQKTVEKQTTYKLPIVGRRRGPKMLKTGMVAKKVKEEEDQDAGEQNAWSKYLAEVRKYKSQKCIEEDGCATSLVK